MGGRVTTCMRCQKSFKPGMDDYHGHAHLLEKVGASSRMSKTRPCSMEGVQVGEKASCESMLFFDILEMTPNYS